MADGRAKESFLDDDANDKGIPSQPHYKEDQPHQDVYVNVGDGFAARCGALSHCSTVAWCCCPSTSSIDAKPSSSRLFSSLSPWEAERFEKETLAFNNHQRAISVDTFRSRPELKGFFRLLSTNCDRKGTEFVSLLTQCVCSYPYELCPEMHVATDICDIPDCGFPCKQLTKQCILAFYYPTQRMRSEG